MAATAYRLAQASSDIPLCSLDDDEPAVAFCTVCVRPFSARYLGIRTDGRAVCHRCSVREEIPVTAFDRHIADPVLAGGWLRAVVRLVTRPYQVFGSRYDGSIAPALLFGFAATWFGFLSTTGWNLAFHGDAMVEMIMNGPFRETGLDESFARRALWLFTPVAAALRMAVGALLFHAGTMVATGARQGTARANVRVFALTSGTLTLCAVPAIGPFLALVTWFTASMAYLQSQYGLRTLRRLMAVMPAFLAVAAFGPNAFVPG